MTQTSDPLEKRVAFEEFQLYYESTEKVTERRLSANRWNYSICTAIVLVVTGVASWTVVRPNFFALGIGIVSIFCVMAILFCSLWIGQIRDFKKLNEAKFEVLNEMAPLVAFGPSSEDDRSSYSPFDKEWKVLQRLDALQEVSSINIVALKSSNIEYLIPKAFRALFVLIIILAIVGAVLNWDVFVNSLSLTVTPDLNVTLR